MFAKEILLAILILPGVWFCPRLAVCAVFYTLECPIIGTVILLATAEHLRREWVARRKRNEHKLGIRSGGQRTEPPPQPVKKTSSRIKCFK